MNLLKQINELSTRIEARFLNTSSILSLRQDIKSQWQESHVTHVREHAV